MKTLKYEQVYRCEYRNLQDAYRSIRHFLEEVYNRKRLHSAIVYLPPEEFESRIAAQPTTGCTLTHCLRIRVHSTSDHWLVHGNSIRVLLPTWLH